MTRSRALIDLDNNATTAIGPAARAALIECLDAGWGNPSSIHAAGARARDAVEDARCRIAARIGARPAEIVFTSGATESINMALRGAAAADRGARRLVVSRVEHTAVLEVAAGLEREGFRVDRLPVEANGLLPPARLEEALAIPATLTSLIAANNETGVVLDLPALVAGCRAAGTPLHLDLVQWAAKRPLDLAATGCDLASFSGHKFGAPKGVGFTWIRRGTRLKGFTWGGHQERGRRPGTENVPGIVAMAAALEESESLWRREEARIAALRDRLESVVLETIAGVLVNGREAPRLANTSNLCFRGIEGAAVVLGLSQKGILCASGSACTAHLSGPSHVLVAMGVPADHVHGSVRFSLGPLTSEADVDRTLAELAAVVAHVRRVDTPLT